MEKELSVTVLGTVSPYCKGDKNCPGFLVNYGNKNILLDCGNGISRLLKFPDDLNNLDIFISHLHPDHYGDLSTVAQAALVYKKMGYLENDINIHVPDGDRYRVKEKDSTRYVYDNIPAYTLIKNFETVYPVNIRELLCYNNINIDDSEKDITISCCKVPHQLESYAFKIATPQGNIVYSSDTGTNNTLDEFAKDADLFICESTFLKGQIRVENAHLYAKEAAQIAKKANVKKLLLTHFWPEIDRQLYLSEAKEIFENTDVAVEGKKLILKK